MEINGKEYLSPQEQLYENTKDIEKLKEFIKTTYKTWATLTSSSASVSTAETNVGVAKEGWLMTEDGLLFRIDGNDGITILLTYWADLKGPQGIPGAEVQIDDDTTALNKTWSSNKIESAIQDLIDDVPAIPRIDATFSQSKILSMITNGCYYTTTTPNPSNELSVGEIKCKGENMSWGYTSLVENSLKAGDTVLYIDNDGNLASIWYAVSFSSGTVTLAKICDIGGGGSQLYQHNIICQNDISKHQRFSLTIINNVSTQMGVNDVRDFLNTNGYEPSDTTPLLVHNYYKCDGVNQESGVLYIIYGIWYKNSNVWISVINASGSAYNVQVNTANDTYYDKVIPL